MFSARRNNRLRSFAMYLGMGYLIVYALCTGVIFFLITRVITVSARGFDREDVLAESEELVELLTQNTDGNLLAEQVTMGRYPPSTIFIVRVINRRGLVEYTITWPKKIDLPDWRAFAEGDENLPREGLSEYYIRPLKRHVQIQTTHLPDGRVLQVGKGSFLEVDQKSMLVRILLIYAALSTFFSIASGICMMLITLRPIHRITKSMSDIIRSQAFETGAPPVRSLIAELDTLGQLFTIMTGKYANLIRAMRETMENVAHDFRTPLARIRGASELALHREHLPAELTETLADIIEDCDRLQLQLQNLMDAREMESGFVRLNRQPFRLNQLLGEIVDLYSLLAEEKRLTLSYVNACDRDVLFDGDRNRLARAFANLMDNALKYTPNGGRVDLTLETGPDAVRVCVRDTGIGISEAEQTLVWQRLFRGKQARETEKGLGLGLNIVQIIISAHGGTVSLESQPGAGSVFRVTLPFRDAPS